MAGTARKQTKPSVRTRAKRTSRQGEVTQAAIEIFWQKGYQATSIQDVADRVGVLKGSLYYYIDSKEDLLWRIIEDVHREWSEILARASEIDAGPVGRIHDFIRMHVEWYLNNVKEVSVFFREWQHLTGTNLKTVKARRHTYEQVIRDMMAAAQDTGEVPEELDLHYAARYVLAAVNAVPDWYRPSGADSASDIATAYADMTAALLTAPPYSAD